MARSKLWGRHRRRHIRNETLTMVWNYTSTTVKEWWARATGETNSSAIIIPYQIQYLKDWILSIATGESGNSSTTNTTEPTVELQEMPTQEIEKEQPKQQGESESDPEKGNGAIVID